MSTRGPQCQTVWTVEPVTNGYLVTANLCGNIAQKNISLWALSKSPRSVCDWLTRMQQTVNTIWHYKHRMRAKEKKE